MTLDMSAETGLGAAGCALGSQTWSGTRPAFAPKPTSARTKTKLLRPDESVAADMASAEQSHAPSAGKRSKNDARMDPSPNCVMPRYQLPALTVSGSSASVMTSSYELIAIPSQKRTNQKMLSARGTRLMLN